MIVFDKCVIMCQSKLEFQWTNAAISHLERIAMTTEKAAAVEFFDYQEGLGRRVARFLFSKGFDQGNFVGQASEHDGVNGMGILYKDPTAKPRKYLFGLITRAPRRSFFGNIQFANKNREHWILEVYGRKYVEVATKLAEEMSKTFDVKIVVHLVFENPMVEKYWNEVD